MTGWMTPDALIEADSSFKALESNTFLGWLGFGSTWSTSTSSSVSPSDGVEEGKAPRPRPRPRLLFMCENLPRELQVCDGPTRAQVVQHHGLAVTRRFAEADVAWDDGLVDLAGEISVHLFTDLRGHARPPIEHREHDAADA